MRERSCRSAHKRRSARHNDDVSAARDPFRPATWRGTIEPPVDRAAAAPRRAAPKPVSAPMPAPPPTTDARAIAEPQSPASGSASAEPEPASTRARPRTRARQLVATAAQRRQRRRRAAAWSLATAVVLGGLAFAGQRLSAPPSAEAVAERIHEAVQREAAAQSGDPTLRVGPLDCVQLEPGRGNCLADARSQWRPMEGMMIAVAYEPDPGGELTWTVRLP